MAGYSRRELVTLSVAKAGMHWCRECYFQSGWVVFWSFLASYGTLFMTCTVAVSSDVFVSLHISAIGRVLSALCYFLWLLQIFSSWLTSSTQKLVTGREDYHFDRLRKAFVNLIRKYRFLRCVRRGVLDQKTSFGGGSF